jgi:hypothetical protein
VEHKGESLGELRTKTHLWAQPRQEGFGESRRNNLRGTILSDSNTVLEAWFKDYWSRQD